MSFDRPMSTPPRKKATTTVKARTTTVELTSSWRLCEVHDLPKFEDDLVDELADTRGEFHCYS